MKLSQQIRPITIRDDKGHRQATWLELFFGLAFTHVLKEEGDQNE